MAKFNVKLSLWAISLIQVIASALFSVLLTFGSQALNILYAQHATDPWSGGIMFSMLIVFGLFVLLSLLFVPAFLMASRGNTSLASRNILMIAGWYIVLIAVFNAVVFLLPLLTKKTS